MVSSNSTQHKMKVSTLNPEHLIAVRWLNWNEAHGKTEKISDPNVFKLHISEAEEEGELRANHRKIDHAETIKIAAERLKSGKWPKTLAAFMAKSKPLPPPYVGSVRRKLKNWSGEWFALGSRGIHPSTAAMMERLGLAEKRPRPHGSRDYDWRLTERGKIEKDRNDT